MFRKKQNYDTKKCEQHGPTASVYLMKTQVKFVNNGEDFVGYVRHTDAAALCGKSLEELKGESECTHCRQHHIHTQ